MASAIFEAIPTQSSIYPLFSIYFSQQIFQSLALLTISCTNSSTQNHFNSRKKINQALNFQTNLKRKQFSTFREEKYFRLLTTNDKLVIMKPSSRTNAYMRCATYERVTKKATQNICAYSMAVSF